MAICNCESLKFKKREGDSCLYCSETAGLELQNFKLRTNVK